MTCISVGKGATMTPVKIKGVYYAFWTCVPGYCDNHKEPGRHKVSLRTSDKREAVARCRALDERLEAERARNALGIKPPVQSNKLLSEFIAEYQEAVRYDKADSTRQTEYYHLQNLVKFTGDRPLKDLSPELLETYKAHRLRHAAPRTWNTELSTLKAVFAWGLTRHPPLYDVNPFVHVKHVAKGKPKIEKYVAPEEIDAAQGPEFWLNALEFLRVTWCRAGELRRLRWADVNYSIGFLEFKYPKERRNKSLPLTSAVLRILQTAKRLRPDSMYVFADKGGGMLTRGQVYHGIRNLGKAALVKLSPHMLRHSGITNALRGGANIFAVQAVAGHSEITTTQGYEHTDLREKRRAMEVLESSRLVMTQPEAGNLLKEIPPKSGGDATELLLPPRNPLITRS